MTATLAEAPTQETPPAITLTVLGSGTRVLLRERSMAGYALTCADHLLLLDCGDGVLRRGLEAGLPLLTVDAILITHFHLDHIADLPPLLWALHGEGEQRQHRPLQVYGPPGLQNFWKGLAALYGRWIEDIAVPIRVREVSAQAFETGPWQVQALPMNHGVPANGYRLQSGGRVLAYTGDTGPCPEVAELAAAADLLIAECSFPNGRGVANHLTAGEVGAIARSADCRQVLLSHLYPESLAAPVVAQCREFFSGEIKLARDLDRLTL
ncbi:MAG: ribonuclease Z [candidate division KSB1 bacterium]|nr:ribonuclease Z [candidate division KSB1 bacterium]MDZ7272660.1 ribonuclease Z [candidate division KSB1 bacterium]MDZ7284318.1 ribonuclease Z [candidate division KSB1 bacterium]MDZ7297286.1 ribonuclease Z [candidate division KSB1 bacterium]MDZ7309509.1 ribonuclease Z [candidate division KSB1 bacterium]